VEIEIQDFARCSAANSATEKARERKNSDPAFNFPETLVTSINEIIDLRRVDFETTRKCLVQRLHSLRVKHSKIPFSIDFDGLGMVAKEDALNAFYENVLKALKGKKEADIKKANNYPVKRDIEK
jgi:hypothetical protein